MMPSKEATGVGFVQRFSHIVISSLESFFYRWGCMVATRPYAFIFACLLFASSCVAGFLGFYREIRTDKLWIPYNSEFIEHTNWIREHFPSPIRFQFALVEAEDVLQPKVMLELLKMHQRVENITVEGKTWQDICFRIPVAPTVGTRTRRNVVRRKRDDAGDDDFFHHAFDDFDNQINHIAWNNTSDGIAYGGEKTLHEGNNSSINQHWLPDNFDQFDRDFEKGTDIWSNNVDPSIALSRGLYCAIIESLKEVCWENSILELWKYDEETIANLTKDDILQALNKEKYSPVFGTLANYTRLLGEVQRNESGHIIGAKAVWIRWYNKINFTALYKGAGILDAGLGEEVDVINMEWEGLFVEQVLNYRYPEDMTVFARAWRSFSDISSDTIVGDMKTLGIGFLVVFVYVGVMIGEFSFLEQRILSSVMGLMCIPLSIAVSYGICSAFSLLYSPIHNALPLLLMGIGIDDMFVIVQCWRNLSAKDQNLTLEERIGLTMQHAGVSITVTSLTDFVAFAIGATTVLPALQSFCVYAALGVLSVYVFQATFFLAWFSIDQRRLESGRNPLLCFIRHSRHRHHCLENKDSTKKKGLRRFFGSPYGTLLTKLPVKVFVILVTFSTFAVCIWGNLQLRWEFDPTWFLPTDSYLFRYGERRKHYFPTFGEEGLLVIGNVNYTADMVALDNLISDLRNSSDVIGEMDDWYGGFKEYVNKNFKADIPNTQLSTEQFNDYMSRYLYSPSGTKYRYGFKVNGEMRCRDPLPPIEVTRFFFKFRHFKGPEYYIPARHKLKNLVESQNFTSPEKLLFPWSIIFSVWETDEVIGEELYRNMGLALSCVFLTTLVLIANFHASIMVLLCVGITLVDVMGCMYFWGLTIDTVSCINLVLAIGLCVDYAAHVGHTFMVRTGSRDQRVINTLEDIGPAVLNGGFSTFLAFIFLLNSRSHIFITFFKVFFLVIVFGLYHGLVFLPVVLSLFGPQPYQDLLSQGSQHHPHVEDASATPWELEELHSKGAAQSSEAATKATTALASTKDV